MRSCQTVRLTGIGQRAFSVTMAKADLVLAVITIDRQLQPFRQCVHHRHTNTMQSAGYLVGIIVELTAGMKLRHDHLGRRHTLLGVDLDRNAAPVVGDRHRPVAIQDHLDKVAMSGQRLIDGVVDNLIDHMVQAGPVIGVADIHPRTLANGVKAFQDLD